MIVGIDASNLRGGGGITHLRELLAAAEPLDFGIRHVIVWARKELACSLDSRIWLEVRTPRLLDGNRIGRLLWQRFILPRAARRECNLMYVPGGNFAGRGGPYVTMSRNLLPFEPGERQRYRLGMYRLRLALLRWAQVRTFRSADAIIFVSRYAEELVTSQLDLSHVRKRIIPHGVSERFLRDPSPRSGGDDTSFRLIYVSTVDLYKHQWHVAEAVGRLRREGYPVELDLFGKHYPFALRRLESVLEQVDPDRQFIRYHGNVPHSQIHRHYHAADAAVFASSCENLPNVLIEAMASGLPVASSDRGPMPEVLGDAGLYFDPERPGEITAAIRELMMDGELREKLGKRARVRAKRYSWRITAQRTMEFLAEVGRANDGQER